MMISTPKDTTTSKDHYVISPNPVSDRLYIKIPDPSLSNETQLSLLDLNGQLISKNYGLSIDLGGLASGIYFVLIYSDGVLVQQEKVVVQH